MRVCACLLHPLAYVTINSYSFSFLSAWEGGWGSMHSSYMKPGRKRNVKMSLLSTFNTQQLSIWSRRLCQPNYSQQHHTLIIKPSWKLPKSPCQNSMHNQNELTKHYNKCLAWRVPGKQAQPLQFLQSERTSFLKMCFVQDRLPSSNRWKRWILAQTCTSSWRLCACTCAPFVDLVKWDVLTLVGEIGAIEITTIIISSINPFTATFAAPSLWKWSMEVPSLKPLRLFSPFTVKGLILLLGDISMQLSCSGRFHTENSFKNSHTFHKPLQYGAEKQHIRFP